MADAKKTLELTVDDSQLKALNKELASGQQEVEKYKAKLKELEKATQNGNAATAEQTASMVKLRQAINTQAAENKRLADAIKNTTKEMNKQNEAAQALAAQQTGFGALINGIKQGFADAGINLGGFTDKLGSLSAAMNSTTLMGAGIVTSAAAISGALIDAGRDVSAMANQFIAYGKTMENATELYNEFNAVYRSTNYDEQAVYDLAKGFLNVHMSAQESAKMIMVCADASASLGQGIEMTNMLADCFKRLATDGELTERQYKALAEAGIDLSDVQDDMRKGGEAAYEALKNKLAQYEGGMANAKQTAAEMEGDIKGNLVEISRQTALLVDEFLGFSETLRGFYQWVIDASQAAIDGIKNMISAMRNAKASADAYGAAVEEWEANYADIWEKKRDQYKSEEEWEAARALAVSQYANATAAVVVETEKQKQDAISKTEALRNKVTSIAKVSSGLGGGGAKQSTVKDDSKRVAQEEERKYQAILKETDLISKDIYANEDKKIGLARQLWSVGKSRVELLKEEAKWAAEDAQRQTDAENSLYAQKIAHLEEQKKYYEANPGLPGASATLAAIEKQIIKEGELHSLRLQNIDAEKEARIASTDEILATMLENDNPGSDLSGDSLNGISQAIDKMISAKENLKSLGIEMTSLQNLALNTFGKSFASAFESIVNGSKSAKEAFTNMAKQLLVQCANLLAQWTAIFAMVTAFKGPKVGAEAANKMVLGLATGGYISGPGTSTSDNIPAMLSNGEYVLNASSVDAIGVDNLNRINAAGRNADAFVGGSTIGGSVTFNVSAMDASGFADFLNRGGLDRIKQALFEDNRGFGAEVGAW